MPRIDLLFPDLKSRLPTDRGYPLYSALSRILPRLHDGTLPFRLMPNCGTVPATFFHLFLDRQGEPIARVWQTKMGSTATIRRPAES